MGNKTGHPLVSVIDLSKATPTAHCVKFDFYTLFLIENECDEFIYGRKYDDYSNATLLLSAPGQSIQMNEGKPLPRKGWLLAFHPHLICGTSLGMNINNYTFFSYRADEALHLSLREKTKATECLTNIAQEIQHPIDRHSQTLISRHIELLLDYCCRYYERQLITRCEANKLIINKVDSLLDEYIASGKLKNNSLPSAGYCSDILSLSSPYLNDLLKFETGKTTKEYFQAKRIEAAKNMLLHKESNLDQIAEKLGFTHVESFSKLFQKITGALPGIQKADQN